ncbi:spore germination protein [Geomicrobium sediminis]|uniref:Stage V sporulation protein AF n=1 Tax=Geomicrobium sediminis TaxID=1347788 RepID=A0ABS2P875_9BACL|nr:spore germination protein [Geomicrobium sediminis]MBM7631599.1 stage V sporulation protein AF [Geomicrobium sediminis]
MKRKRTLSNDFEQNVETLSKELRVDKNFDLVQHNFQIGDIKLCMFLVDGFGNDLAIIHTLENLSRIDNIKDNVMAHLEHRFIPQSEIERSNDLDEILTNILAGQSALLVEGYDEALMIDAREYPVRSPEEPDLERVVRGPRDGFVETLVFNSALIRRRLRDPSLIMEHVQVGTRSKTDIVIGYISSVADPEIAKRLKKKLKSVNIDGLTMGEKTLEEFLFKESLSPYPRVRYTERPDTAATHMLEGHVIIITDGSPSVMIFPTTYWHHMQHAEEYRQEPIVGAFLRWVRIIAVFFSIFLLPGWFLLEEYAALGPTAWDFIGVSDDFTIPIFVQVLIAEFGLEVLRMAAIHTPNALATALGLVAAILISEIAIEVGVFTGEVVLYTAVVAMAGYATPSYEMGLCNRIIRLVLVFSVGFFGPIGFMIACMFFLITLVKTKTLNTPYMWPFLPFNARAAVDFLFRIPQPYKNNRPSIVNPMDKKRQS